MLKRTILVVIFGFLCLNLQAQNKIIETSGDIMLIALPALTYASTYLNVDKVGRKQFIKGFITNQAITYGLKLVVDKPRPDLSNLNSFPSGHTSTTFQSAAFVYKRYGWEYGIPAFLLAGFTGFSRINADKHDGWDVVGGALIGIGSTLIFTTPYQQEHINLTFSGNNGNYLLGFELTF